MHPDPPLDRYKDLQAHFPSTKRCLWDSGAPSRIQQQCFTCFWPERPRHCPGHKHYTISSRSCADDAY